MNVPAVIRVRATPAEGVRRRPIKKATPDTCPVCGTLLDPQSAATYCSTACRHEFDNRRKSRGAILYDLFMANRFDRKRAKELKVYTLMCRAASLWKAEDDRDRDGRPSYHPPRIALSRVPYLHSVTVVRRRK